MFTDEVKKINEASLNILENIGIEVLDNEVLDICRENGFRVEGNRIFISREDVKKYVSMAPSEFTIYAKDEKYNMNINMEDIYYAPSYGCTKVRNYDGSVRNAMLGDFLNFLKIIEVSDNFNINGGILVQPNDIEENLSNIIMMYIALIGSNKCVFGIPGNYKAFQQIIDLASICFGGNDKLKEKTRFITIASTISPLKIDSNTVACIKLSAKYNQALLVSPAPMAGGSGPITLAGNIAMGSAEGLTVIVLSQLLNPGTPVIYGSSAMAMDMKTGSNLIGAPEFALQGKYYAAIGKMYNLPTRINGCLTDANGATIQAGYQAMMCVMSANESKGNFVLSCSGTVDSYACISYEKMMADLEIVNMLRYYYKGIEVNEKTLALDLIKEVSYKNGSFLTEKQTAKLCRKVPYNPIISMKTKLSLDDTPFNLMKDNMDKKYDEIINKYTMPTLGEDVLQKLDEYMIKSGVSLELLQEIKEKLHV